MRPCHSVWILLVLAAAAAPARAAEVDGHHPPCGAPGDLVYVQGARLAPQPVVTLGGVRAEVVRARAGALLCRVPPGLEEGPVELRVDGAPAPGVFHALAPGRPVVHGLSAALGTRGQALLVHGRRLHHGHAAFVDAAGRTAATVGVVGGRRAVVLRVPETLDPGPYTVVLLNGDGLSTGPCSPRFEVVLAHGPELCALQPVGAMPSRTAGPGQRIRCVGTDLGPRGPCRVRWRDRHGAVVERRGASNGYDAVLTRVPGELRAGEPYDVEIELGDGAATPALSWTPAVPDAPGTATAVPSSLPAGGLVSVRGTGLSARVDAVRAELSSPDGAAAAALVYRHPGGPGHGAAWILRLPEELAAGEYDLTVAAGERSLPPVGIRVAEQPLGVTGLWPTRGACAGTERLTVIEGAGFGSTRADSDLRVVWTNGARTLEGTIVFRSDRVLRVLPPGAHHESASQPAENCSVYVLRGRGAATRAIKAGRVHLTGW